MTEVKIKLSEKDKKALDQFCFETGLDIDTLFNVYIKKIIHTGKIPFEIEDDLFYRESNIKALRESIRQYNDEEIIETSIEDLIDLE